jgi:transcriptional regulator with XRE-family HTH domain
MARSKTDETKAFGKRIRAARMRKRVGRHRFTQAQLAAALGVERNTVSRWENGTMLPKDPAMAVAIARVLDVRVEWLVGALGNIDVTDAAAAREGTGDPYSGASIVTSRLPQAAVDLMLMYLERLTSAGCDSVQVKEAERFLVIGAGNRLLRKAFADRTMTEVQSDIDDAWDFVTRVLRRDGIRVV